MSEPEPELLRPLAPPEWREPLRDRSECGEPLRLRDADFFEPLELRDADFLEPLRDLDRDLCDELREWLRERPSADPPCDVAECWEPPLGLREPDFLDPLWDRSDCREPLRERDLFDAASISKLGVFDRLLECLNVDHEKYESLFRTDLAKQSSRNEWKKHF